MLRNTHHEPDFAFFVELEADSSALQMLTERCTIDDIRPLLEPSDDELGAVVDLTGADKIIAFRVLFAGIWQVVLQFESRETRSHPWPAARLLSLLSTLMEYYVIGGTLTEDERGTALELTTDEAVATAKEYLRSVVGPATKFALAQLPEDERLTLSPDPSIPSSVYADVLGDLEAFILGAEMQTPAGRQLGAVIKRKADLAERLAPHRYIEDD